MYGIQNSIHVIGCKDLYKKTCRRSSIELENVICTKLKHDFGGVFQLNKLPTAKTAYTVGRIIE